MDMEERVQSREMLQIIRKNMKIFIGSFMVLTLLNTVKILTMPVQFEAQAFFKYMGIEPQSVTVKEDNNGTVTLKKYELGEDNLDIQTLIKGREFAAIRGDNRVSLRYDSGNGNYILRVVGSDQQEVKEIADSYLELIQEKNIEFLKNKLKIEKDSRLKEKLQYEIDHQERSFPIALEAEIGKKIDRRRDILFIFGEILAILISMLLAFIWEELKEVKGKR